MSNFQCSHRGSTCSGEITVLGVIQTLTGICDTYFPSGGSGSTLTLGCKVSSAGSGGDGSGGDGSSNETRCTGELLGQACTGTYQEQPYMGNYSCFYIDSNYEVHCAPGIDINSGNGEGSGSNFIVIPCPDPTPALNEEEELYCGLMCVELIDGRHKHGWCEVADDEWRVDDEGNPVKICKCRLVN